MTVGLLYRPRRRGFRWTAADIPDLTGTTALVTGANSGIGFETTAALAAAGARVMLACRNDTKAAAATEVIRERHDGAELDLVRQTSWLARAHWWTTDPSIKKVVRPVTSVKICGLRRGASYRTSTPHETHVHDGSAAAIGCSSAMLGPTRRARC